MTRIEAEIEIAAPADRVWAVLSAIDRWPEWNPVFPELRGRLQLGARLDLRVDLGPATPNLRIRATLIELEPGISFAWRGGLGGVLVGVHSFAIEPVGPDRSRVLQIETFRGPLRRVAGRTLLRQIQQAHVASNEALRSWVEEGRAWIDARRL